MKKLIYALLVVGCMGITLPAQAQLKLGVKAGLNLSSSSFDFNDVQTNFKSDNYTGFFVGPMVEFTAPVIGIGVDGSILYSQKGLKFTETKTNTSETLKQKSLSIPVNLKYTIGLDAVGIFFAAGPQFDFDLNSDSWKFLTEDFSYKKSTMSLNIGAGVKLIDHLQIGLNYNIPLGKTAEYKGIASTVNQAFSAKTKTWSVSAAYLF